MRSFRIFLFYSLLLFIMSGFAFAQTINVSLPDTTGESGTSVTVPIMVGDLTGRGVISYECVITFDENVLDATGASSSGTLTQSFVAPTVNITVAGQIKVGSFGTLPLSGSGTLVNLNFDVVGQAGDTTALVFESFIFNSNDTLANTADGKLTIPVVKFAISGGVSYCPTGGSVGNVTMNLLAGASDTRVTDSNGDYLFENLAGNLDYTVTASKENDIGPSSITCFDAALAARIAVDLDSADHCDSLAADVDQDGNIFTFDAALICRFGVGLPSFGLNDHTGEWRFDPASRSYPALDSDQSGQDYVATLLGDVDGNWTPANSAQSLSKVTFEDYEYLTDMVASAGELVSIPLMSKEGLRVLSADIDFEYDPQVLRFVEVSATGLSDRLEVLTHAEAGRLRVGAYGTEAVLAGGELFTLRFEVIGQEGAQSSLFLKRYQLNGGSVQHAEAALVVEASGSEIPQQFALRQNYPNPFNPETRIRFDLPLNQAGSARVQLAVYNISGQLVRALLDEERSPGSYEILWDGRNDVGVRVPSGVYFYKIVAGDFRATKKMVVLK